MSIHGIRNIKNIRKGSLSLYGSEHFENTQSSPNKHGHLQIDTIKANQLFKSFRQTDQPLVKTQRKYVKRNSYNPARQYEKYLDHEIKFKQNPFPIHSIRKQKITDQGFSCFSSRQHRSPISSPTRISNFIKQQDEFKEKDSFRKNKFSLQYVVGKGGFGKVWRVREKKTAKIYAMKQMLKVKVINKKSVSSVMNQKSLLQKLHHPFLVNMHCSFQDTQNLYLVMDYVNGGDLRYHVGNRRKFTQNQTKFFVGCIVTSLSYLHSNHIIHRDIKPENLVIDDQGYVRLTDLGISRQYRPNNGADTSGTPGYMSPEVICKGDHSFSTDFFALGVIVYEFMLGKRPYVGRNRQQIRQQILSKQVKIEQAPPNWSEQAIDFVNRLIQRKPHNRLGHGGIVQIKTHPWLKSFNWVGLLNRTLNAPFRPLTIQQDYNNYQECISEDTVIENEEENRILLRKKQTQQLFVGYECDLTKQSKKIKGVRNLQEPKVKKFFLPK